MCKYKDIEGKCTAHLYIGDDYGDNSSTMRCDLLKNHEGDHCENAGRFVVYWKEDERDYNIYEKCVKCDGWGYVFTSDVLFNHEPIEDIICENCKGEGEFVVGSTK